MSDLYSYRWEVLLKTHVEKNFAGNIEAAISLYESVTEVAPAGACKWAWLRLGLCKLKNNDIEVAIKCLQAALRCGADDQ